MRELSMMWKEALHSVSRHFPVEAKKTADVSVRKAIASNSAPTVSVSVAVPQTKIPHLF